MLLEIKKDKGARTGKATAGNTVVVSFQELNGGTMLLSVEKFKKGKEFYPDETKAIYLIASIAKGKIVVWPKAVEFLESADFPNADPLNAEAAARAAKEAGIYEPEKFSFYRVQDISPLEVYRSFCC